jgi:hypothetical protein
VKFLLRTTAGTHARYLECKPALESRRSRRSVEWQQAGSDTKRATHARASTRMSRS